MSRLTNDVQVGRLTLHRVSVELAHVPAPVALAHVVHVKEPDAAVAVVHRDAVVLCDHVGGDRQDRLRVHA